MNPRTHRHTIGDYYTVRRQRNGRYEVRSFGRVQWIGDDLGEAFDALRAVMGADVAELANEQAKMRRQDEFFEANPGLKRRILEWQYALQQTYGEMQDSIKSSGNAGYRCDFRTARQCAMEAAEIGYDEVWLALDREIKRGWQSLDLEATLSALSCADYWRATSHSERANILRQLRGGEIDSTVEAFRIFAATPRGSVAVAALGTIINGGMAA